MTLLGQLGVPGIMPAMAEGAIWRAVVSSGIFPVKIVKLLFIVREVRSDYILSSKYLIVRVIILQFLWFVYHLLS